MRRTLFRVTLVGAVLALLGAAVASSAFAANGHGRFGRLGIYGIRSGGPGGMGGGGGMFGRGMFGGPGGGGGGFGFGGPGGPGGGPGGGGVLLADVLTPSASFLGISVSTLASDLNGGKTLAQEATAKGKTAADLITAIVAAQKTNLDNEKAAGWITADQETALLASYTTEITALVSNGPSVPPSGQQGGGLLQTASTYLGVSVSDLQSDLQGGKTLADVVTSVGGGKTVDGLVAALVAPAKSNLDSAVTAGKITQAQENTILANLTTRLTNLVNGTKPATTSSMNSVEKTLVKYTKLKRFSTRK